VRSGDPVRGIGLPRPSVVVAKVFSNPTDTLVINSSKIDNSLNTRRNSYLKADFRVKVMHQNKTKSNK
jgi:hypothetical protein